MSSTESVPQPHRRSSRLSPARGRGVRRGTFPVSSEEVETVSFNKAPFLILSLTFPHPRISLAIQHPSPEIFGC